MAQIIKSSFELLTGDISGFFTTLFFDVSDLFSQTIEDVGGIGNFFSNFFVNLRDFFIHIVIPKDEQWEEIKQDYSTLGDTLSAKIPFVSAFTSELEKAQDSVSRTDFLKITIPSFSYHAGGIGVTTGEQQVINVSEKYEPYREYVRSGLFLIVVGLGFVYIIKYVLRFGQTHAAEKVRGEED